MLSAGFLKGQLSLSMIPSQEFLNLPDPYNPVQNQRYRATTFVLPNGYGYTAYFTHDLSLARLDP